MTSLDRKILSLKEHLQKTPIYDAYLLIMNHWLLATWERKGCPMPPPPLIKQRCVLEYQKRFKLDILIETGTYRGDMVRATRSAFREIYSIELGIDLYQRAQRLFARFPHIHLLHGDSSMRLRDLSALLNRQALFWLDAHYSGRGTALGDYETPIMAELDCIFAHPIKSHVILIDDARCFDGRHDYPTLEGLKSHVSNRSPESSFIVADDIIRITPPGLPK